MVFLEDWEALLAPFLETIEVLVCFLWKTPDVFGTVAGVHFELPLGGPFPVEMLHDLVGGSHPYAGLGFLP